MYMHVIDFSFSGEEGYFMIEMYAMKGVSTFLGTSNKGNL